MDGWPLDEAFTAPLADLPGERDLHAVYIDTGTEGQNDRLLRGKLSFRDDLRTSPLRGTFDVVERYDDEPELRATYAFEIADPDVPRVELTWSCGDRVPFFEGYTGALTYIVDFQVAFTREASGGEPEITRDYRTREF